ncbi:hypothetical protein CRG98_024533 [Punica granatum]|uniref:CMP/dCMP-type deaminase domain-containing protein n=1 Tax=Punica granatum TaxID=22663 RepID=A0A2I0JFP0_PUNGR|nr:hypothetical protein CRG98_024533 [Punica granatum]
MGSDDIGQWRIEYIPDKPPVPPDQQPTVDVVASPIDPKFANAIVRRLNQVAPLENLRHVKRVQKKCLEGGKAELSVVLCIVPDNGDLRGMPPDVQELISSYQLSTFTTKVCKYAALSKEEWEAQCKLWPTSYHPPTYNISGITGFSEDDSRSVFSFMKYAVELATSGNEWGPLEKPYLCTGYDIYLAWEPCVMCAMALVHQRIRRIFYAFPNASAGALGSVQRLQGEKSLNHHYAVFRVFMPQDTLRT